MTTVSKLIGEIEARGVDEYVAGVRRVSSETESAGSRVDGATSGMSSKLQGLGDKMKSVGGAMQQVGGKLTKWVTLPIVGLASIVGGLAIGGGISRALNIEEAKAKLAGLGHSTKTVDKIMQSALKSVKGTAFGLDEAASGAASAVAAGVKPGKDLTRVLGLTADAATIMGRSFGESGQIVNKILASNRVSMEEVNQLHDAGLPILSMLAKQYGVTAGEMRDMVSQGKVDSKSFMKALETNVGGAALKSGNTTRGAFKNMGAALSRFGERIVKPLLPVMRDLFNDLGENVDRLAEKAGPMADKLAGAMKRVVEWFVNLSPNMKVVIAALIAFAAAIGPILMVGGTLVVLLGSLATAAAALGVSMGALLIIPIAIAAAIAVLVTAGVLLYKNWDTVKAKLSAAWGTIKSTATATWNAINRVVSGAASAMYSAVTGAVGKLRTWLTQAWGMIRQGVSTSWALIKSAAGSAASGVVTAITNAIGRVRGAVTGVWTSIRQGVSASWSLIRSAVVNAAGSVVSGAAGKMGELVGKFASVGRSAGTALGNAIKSAVNAVIDRIRNFSLPTVKVAGKTVPGSGAKPFSGLPRLAKGGLAYGETLAMVGDNPNARIDPEVVAPLSKLDAKIRSAVAAAIGDNGVGGGGVTQHFHVQSPVEHMTAFMRRARFEARAMGAG